MSIPTLESDGVTERLKRLDRLLGVVRGIEWDFEDEDDFLGPTASCYVAEITPDTYKELQELIDE